jgi:hypothetical protein
MKARIVFNLGFLFMMLFCASITNTGSGRALDSAKNASLAQAKALVMRLDIINVTDQSKLTRAEKRIQRKEIRYIKRNLKELRGGSYLPTSVIVLLLLIPVSVFQLTE